MPLATLLEPAEDTGLSLVFSPEDTILSERLTTHLRGQIRFSRVQSPAGRRQAGSFRDGP